MSDVLTALKFELVNYRNFMPGVLGPGKIVVWFSPADYLFQCGAIWELAVTQAEQGAPFFWRAHQLEAAELSISS